MCPFLGPWLNASGSPCTCSLQLLCARRGMLSVHAAHSARAAVDALRVCLSVLAESEPRSRSHAVGRLAHTRTCNTPIDLPTRRWKPDIGSESEAQLLLRQRCLARASRVDQAASRMDSCAHRHIQEDLQVTQLKLRARALLVAPSYGRALHLDLP